MMFASKRDNLGTLRRSWNFFFPPPKTKQAQPHRRKRHKVTGNKKKGTHAVLKTHILFLVFSQESSLPSAQNFAARTRVRWRFPSMDFSAHRAQSKEHLAETLSYPSVVPSLSSTTVSFSNHGSCWLLLLVTPCTLRVHGKVNRTETIWITTERTRQNMN